MLSRPPFLPSRASGDDEESARGAQCTTSLSAASRVAAARHATTTAWPPRPRRSRAWARACSRPCFALRLTSRRLACRCRPSAGATCGTAACWVHCRPSSGRRASPAGSAALHPPSAPSQSSGRYTSRVTTLPRRRSSMLPALTACSQSALACSRPCVHRPRDPPPAQSALWAREEHPRRPDAEEEAAVELRRLG